MVDSAAVLQKVRSRNIERCGELVSIKSITKSGEDSEGMGTYDDNITTVEDVRMIITEAKNPNQRTEPEGTIQNKEFRAEFKHDQDLAENDIIVRADGSVLYVVNTWGLRPGNVLICKFAKLQDSVVAHGTD